MATVNIQRGRDQGLHPYNDYLEVGDQRKIYSFNQLPRELAEKRAKVYRHPNDMDWWSAGKGSKRWHVGLTFAELLADLALKPEIVISMSIIVILIPVTLLWISLLCDNADSLSFLSVLPVAFVLPDDAGNEPVPCDSHKIPRMDMEAWRAL